MPNASLRRVSVSDADAQNRVLCEKLSFFAKVVNEKQVISGTFLAKTKRQRKMFQNAFQNLYRVFRDQSFEVCSVVVFLISAFFFHKHFFHFVQGHPVIQSSGTRISLYCAEILKLHSFQLRITLQDVLELTDMVSAMAAMEAESVEPHEEIRARDPLSLEQPQKMSVACSIELDGITLQILAPRPVLEFGLGACWGETVPKVSNTK